MASGTPAAMLVDVELAAASLSDNRSHERRLREALLEEAGDLASRWGCGRIGLPLETARTLPGVMGVAASLRQGSAGLLGLSACLCRSPEGLSISQVYPKKEARAPYGLGVDLGSTSVVFHLVDLAKGRVAETISRHNPQAVHGEDILERILFAGRADGLKRLQSEIVGLFNDSVRQLSQKAGISAADIHYCSVAGNTTMCHFFLALDPSNICREPYIPVVNRFDLIRPGEIGLEMNRNGWVYLFPNIGSYFGGDLVAGIIASGMHESDEISMLVDVGTNAEVILGNKDWLVACAGAAGPALEGGILTCGMRAQPGAIERVRIDPRTLEIHYETIGNEAPKGLCGSGIIDLMAALFEAGLVDSTGKLLPERAPERMRQLDGFWAFVVADEGETAHGRPVFITQSDIKNLIRSKGAMYTILNVVIQSVGIEFSDIQNFYVAGAFGNYIDPERAITIGMLPDIPLDRFKGLGNAAGEGAVNVLLDASLMDEAERICDQITYLEMNVRGDFMSQLTGALFLPHTDLSRFPSVARRLDLK
jgi:uncharacterized 2Fe-2S/4Fe-4S cluster protein (DUF4445 family)